LKELVDEFRGVEGEADIALSEAIYNTAAKSGILNDVPLKGVDHTKDDSPSLSSVVSSGEFGTWINHLSNYLVELQDRLFSSGLRQVSSCKRFCPTHIAKW